MKLKIICRCSVIPSWWAKDLSASLYISHDTEYTCNVLVRILGVIIALEFEWCLKNGDAYADLRLKQKGKLCLSEDMKMFHRVDREKAMLQ